MDSWSDKILTIMEAQWCGFAEVFLFLDCRSAKDLETKWNSRCHPGMKIDKTRWQQIRAERRQYLLNG